MKLVKGKGSKKTGACWMSAIAWYEGNSEWTDAPDCVCPIIRGLAIKVNDTIDSNEEREHLISPIMFSVVGTANPDLVLPRRQKVVAFAAAKARSVLHLVPTEHTDIARKAIEAAEAWAANPSEANREAADHAARAAARATYACAYTYVAYAPATTLGQPKFLVINELIDLILELAAMGEKREVIPARSLKSLP
jgi:hypothetical protein